jgi:hypothetical protein
LFSTRRGVNASSFASIECAGAAHLSARSAQNLHSRKSFRRGNAESPRAARLETPARSADGNTGGAVATRPTERMRMQQIENEQTNPIPPSTPGWGEGYELGSFAHRTHETDRLPKRAPTRTTAASS